MGQRHYDYFSSVNAGTVFIRQNLTSTDSPRDATSRVKIPID